MNETAITVAGLTVLLRHRHLSRRLTDTRFHASPGAEPDFCADVSEEDLVREREKAKLEYVNDQIRFRRLSPPEVEFTALYRAIAEELPAYRDAVMHGVALAVGEHAFLLAAPSGVGKTTHAKLWLNEIPGARIIDGDKPILRIFPDGVLRVCGTPWNGKERLGSAECVPLDAVCFLSRAAENSIRPAALSEVAPRLLSQTHRPETPAALAATLALLRDAAQHLRFFSLACNTDPAAARLAWEAMRP